MSLILTGINLPKKDEFLNIYIFDNNSVFVATNCSQKIEKAQAIQIPQDHGRIGDLDELRKAIRTDVMGGLNYERFIEDAPTILEPEEE